jgi:hypothetical protein
LDETFNKVAPAYHAAIEACIPPMKDKLAAQSLKFRSANAQGILGVAGMLGGAACLAVCVMLARGNGKFAKRKEAKIADLSRASAQVAQAYREKFGEPLPI